VHVRVLAEVFQFCLFVVGIYCYGHGADFGASVQKGQPVGHITRPDSYMGSPFHADGEQSFGHVVYTLVKLFPGEAQIAVGIYDIFFIGSGEGPMFKPVTQGSRA